MSNNEIVKSQQQAVGVFDNSTSFEHAQRIATMLCRSTLVPEQYQNNMSNTLVALEMANRVGASPLMVMQNLNVIQGRPSWSSPFIIASINSCGRFEPLTFEVQNRGRKNVNYDVWTGSKAQNNRRKEARTITVDDMACRAVTRSRSGTPIEGPWVSIEMAVLEGWYTKSDTKWTTMPDLMLRYRSAAFFGRLYCPEIMLGMQTSEEVIDVHGNQTTSNNPVANVNAILQNPQQPIVTHTANIAAEEVAYEHSQQPPVNHEQPQGEELV